MIATLVLPWSTCVRCGGSTGPEAQPGDTVVMHLRQDVADGLPATITGAIQSVETPLGNTTARIYSIDYETDDITGDVELLVSCMISSFTCMSCCEALQEQIDALDTRVTSAETSITEHETRLDGLDVIVEDLEGRLSDVETLTGTHTTQIAALDTRIDALEADFQVDTLYREDPSAGGYYVLAFLDASDTGPFAYEWRDPSNNVIGITPLIVLANSGLPTFQGGTYQVKVTHTPSGQDRFQIVQVPKPRVLTRVLRVDGDYGNDTTGREWYLDWPFQTLQAALSHAHEGDVIEVYSAEVTSLHVDGSIVITNDLVTIAFKNNCTIRGNLILQGRGINIYGEATFLWGTLTVLSGADFAQVNLQTIYASEVSPSGGADATYDITDGIYINANDCIVNVDNLTWRIDTAAGNNSGIRILSALRASVTVTKQFNKIASQDYTDNNAFVLMDFAFESSVDVSNVSEISTGDGAWLIRAGDTSGNTTPPTRQNANTVRFRGRCESGKMISCIGAVGLIVIADTLESLEDSYNVQNGHGSAGIGITGHDTLNTIYGYVMVDCPIIRLRGAGSPVTTRNHGRVAFIQPTNIQWVSGSFLTTENTAAIAMPEPTLHTSGGIFRSLTSLDEFLDDSGANPTLRVQNSAPVYTNVVGTSMGAVTVRGASFTYGATLLFIQP